MHYYSHHIGDLIRDTANLDNHQLATYMRMIWAYYQSEQPLENNLEDIAFAMRSDEKTVRLLLRHYFVLDGDLWRHTRCDKEIANYHSKSEKASKSAKTRWTKPDLVPEDSEGNANALEKDANALKSDANQEPRTKNQEPKREEKTVSDKPKPSRQNWQQILESLKVESSHARDWLKVREKMKVELTETTLKAMQREAEKAGIDLDTAVRICAEKSWRSFNASWAWQDKPPDKPYETPYAKSMREKYEKMTPMIAAQNPNAPKKLNPNDFINAVGDYQNAKPKLRIAG